MIEFWMVNGPPPERMPLPEFLVMVTLFRSDGPLLTPESAIPPPPLWALLPLSVELN